MKKQARKVLVVNSGSSSLKYQLFDMKSETRLAKGLVERIGSGGPANHVEALEGVVKALGSPKDIDAIGHRVLHGAEEFKDSVNDIITKNVIDTDALLEQPEKLEDYTRVLEEEE